MKIGGRYSWCGTELCDAISAYFLKIIIMNIVAILMSIFIGIIILSLIIYIFYTEPRDFNNGYCKHCGTKLRHFDIDSSSARGYTCDNCGYTTWISYSTDKNFK